MGSIHPSSIVLLNSDHTNTLYDVFVPMLTCKAQLAEQWTSKMMVVGCRRSLYTLWSRKCPTILFEVEMLPATNTTKPNEQFVQRLLTNLMHWNFTHKAKILSSGIFTTQILVILSDNFPLRFPTHTPLVIPLITLIFVWR